MENSVARTLFIFVIMGTLTTTIADCSRDRKSLQPPSGAASYEEDKSICRWRMPEKKAEGHVVLIKMTSLKLEKNTRPCNSTIKLTDIHPFCEITKNSCFIYASLPLCNEEFTLNSMKNENCNESFWLFNFEAKREITITLKKATTKRSFSFDYKYIPCTKSLNENFTSKAIAKSLNENFTSTTIATNIQNSTQGSETPQPTYNGVPSGTFAGVLVLFILLLLATIALAFWLYWRLRKTMYGPKVPRVQYELARSRDITILHDSNLQKNGDTVISSPLHGEHQQSYRPSIATTGIEIVHNVPLDANYNAGGNYSNPDNNDNVSFTSDESEPPEEAPSSVYATLNKAPKT